jgi:hypothetical protein
VTNLRRKSGMFLRYVNPLENPNPYIVFVILKLWWGEQLGT